MEIGPNQVVVLDYSTRLTHVFTYPKGTEDIEAWLWKTHKISASTSAWMS